MYYLTGDRTQDPISLTYYQGEAGDRANGVSTRFASFVTCF